MVHWLDRCVSALCLHPWRGCVPRERLRSNDVVDGRFSALCVPPLLPACSSCPAPRGRQARTRPRRPSRRPGASPTPSSARTRTPARRAASGTWPARAMPASRDLRRTSASIAAASYGSRSTRTRPTIRSRSIAWATTAGWARGDIATFVPTAALPQVQPPCLTETATGLVDCGNWAESASWLVPATATSGIYFAKLTRTDNGGASHIFFIVRDDAGNADLLFQTSDTTWQAYNRYGGKSLYRVWRNQPARYKVSYNRPLTVRGTTPANSAFNAEYPMVRWLEANGFNVSYISGIDTDRSGPAILNPTESQSLPVGRPRRVLVGRSARQRRGSARRRPEPRVLQRQRSVLEDAVGGEHRRHRNGVQDAGVVQRNPCQRRHRSHRRLDGHVARPALQSAGGRRAAGKRADRHDFHRPVLPGAVSEHRRAAGGGGAAILAQFADRGQWRRRAVAERVRDRPGGRRDARLRVRRGSGQRLPPGGSDAAVFDDRDGRRETARLRQHLRQPARRPTR